MSWCFQSLVLDYIMHIQICVTEVELVVVGAIKPVVLVLSFINVLVYRMMYHIAHFSGSCSDSWFHVLEPFWISWDSLWPLIKRLNFS